MTDSNSSRTIPVRMTNGAVRDVPLDDIGETASKQRILQQEGGGGGRPAAPIGACRSFERGNCRFGRMCRFIHVLPRGTTTLPAEQGARLPNRHVNDDDDDSSVVQHPAQQQQQQRQPPWFRRYVDSSPPTPRSPGAITPHGLTPLSLTLPVSDSPPELELLPNNIRQRPRLPPRQFQHRHHHLVLGDSPPITPLVRPTRVLPPTAATSRVVASRAGGDEDDARIDCALCCESFSLLNGPSLFTCTEGHSCCTSCFSQYIIKNWSAQQRSWVESFAAQRELFEQAEDVSTLPNEEELDEMAAMAELLGADNMMLAAPRHRQHGMRMMGGRSLSSAGNDNNNNNHSMRGEAVRQQRLDGIDAKEANRRGQINCFMGHAHCKGRNVDPAVVARHASSEAFDHYMDIRVQQRELKLVGEAMELLDAAVREVRADPAATGDPPSSIKLRELALRYTLDAFCCKHCRWGPILWAGCDEGVSHHGEERSGAIVDNACQRCGRLARSKNELLRWDGKDSACPQPFVEKLKIAARISGEGEEEAAYLASPARARNMDCDFDDDDFTGNKERKRRDLEMFVRQFPLDKPLPESGQEMRAAWATFQQEGRGRGGGNVASRDGSEDEYSFTPRNVRVIRRQHQRMMLMHRHHHHHQHHQHMMMMRQQQQHHHHHHHHHRMMPPGTYMMPEMHHHHHHFPAPHHHAHHPGAFGPLPRGGPPPMW